MHCGIVSLLDAKHGLCGIDLVAGLETALNGCKRCLDIVIPFDVMVIDNVLKVESSNLSLESFYFMSQ